MLLPYVLFVFLYVIYEFETWITGVCSPFVVSLCNLAYYVFGQEPAIAMHLVFCMLCLSAISMMFVKILLEVCILVGMVV